MKRGYILQDCTSCPGRQYQIPLPFSSFALETFQLAHYQENHPTPTLHPSSLQKHASCAKPSPALPEIMEASSIPTPAPQPQGTQTHKSHTSLPCSPTRVGCTWRSAGWTTETRVAGSRLLCQLCLCHEPLSDVCFLSSGKRNPSSLPLSSPKIAVVESAPTAYCLCSWSNKKYWN